MATKTLSVVRNRLLAHIIAALLLVAAVVGIILVSSAAGRTTATIDVTQVRFTQIIGGIAVAAVLVTAFMWFRFKLSRALSSLIVLAYDMVLVFGLASWLAIPVSPAVLAAFVGIAFLSLANSTVFFDRLRERVKASVDTPFAVIVDTSITTVLPRIAVTTSVAVAMSIILPLVLPSGGAHDASLILIGGAVLTAFSAVFLTPLLVFYIHKTPVKHVEAVSAVAEEVKTVKEADTPAKASFSVVAPSAERKLKGKRRDRK